jgi:hypothetical protein
MKRKSLILGLVLLSVFSLATFPQQTYASDVDSPLQVKGTLLTSVKSVITAAQAQITTIATVANKIKGYTLDPIAWVVSKSALQSVVKSTINSINHGSNGAPAFVTNLQKKLQSVGDAQANSFLKQLASTGVAQSPLRQIASTVGKNYFQSTGTNGFFNRNAYSLNKVTKNDVAFSSGKDFTQGGFDAWFSMVMKPQNNSFGALQLATEQLNGQIASAQDTLKADYQAGNGFISWRGSCGATGTADSGSASGKACKTNDDCAGSLACLPNGGPGTCAIDKTLDTPTSLSTSDKCLAYNVQTPGSVLHDAATKAFGSGIDTLVSAHTFDEIVNSLLSQMITKITSGGGFSGLSQSSNSSGGASPGFLNGTDPAQTALNASVNLSLTKVVTDQVTELQTYSSQWGTINSAAQAAKTALSTSTCYPNAQNAIVTSVQPVIDQAATSISQATAAITSLNKVQAPLTSNANATAQLSQASGVYSNFLSSGILPSSSDLSNASAQSSNTPNPDGTPSLLMQMNQLAQAAQTCAATPH